MAEKRRQCGTCRFFMEKDDGGHGTCTHPARRGAGVDLLLLRPNELGCRTQWGNSLWQDPADDSDPTIPKTPQQPTLPEPIAAQLHFDDEVTSVSIAGRASSRASLDDDVVDSGTTVTGMASWNDPVQDVRLDLLRKSSHDAIAGARKRHIEKQARQRELVPFAEGEEDRQPEPTPSPTHEDEAPAPMAAARSFPPDDFVEDERSSADGTAADELVDDGLSPGGRSPRLRKLLRDPKANEAMRIGVPADMHVTSNNPEQREKWNTVPAIKPSIELPASPTPPPAAPLRMSASAAPVLSAAFQPRPAVSQARELVIEDRQRNERSQRQLVAPLAEESLATAAPPVTDRPRLTRAPEPQADTLQQVKASPLRGYHPATRKLTQPATPETSQPQAPATPTRQPAEPAAPQWETYDSSPRQERNRPQPEQPRQAPARAPKPAPAQRKQPYIPLTHVSESTPFVRHKIEISPDVPRCCGTCASYRPSDVPGRGSCTNAFAGPVQRVVNERDRSACTRTFGSFWLPADEEVWLDELPDHSAPTPRVDAMIERRRRRTMPVLPDLEELTS